MYTVCTRSLSLTDDFVTQSTSEFLLVFCPRIELQHVARGFAFQAPNVKKALDFHQSWKIP